MRAALLFSLMWIILGLAALFGVPAISVGGKILVGVAGLATALAVGAIPPLVVLGWRKIRENQAAVVQSGDLPPNKSLERTRER